MAALTLLVPTLSGVGPVARADSALGALAGGVTFSQDCASGIGVGIAYDGENLWYSCYASDTDLFRADPYTGQVTAAYHVVGGLGALAYDATRNVLWAGWGGANTGQVLEISLDDSQQATTYQEAFNVCRPQGGDPGDACFEDIDDGLTYDGGTDTLYISPDTSTSVYHYNVNGTRVHDGDSGTGEFTWAGSSCYNSGLAIGDQLLFEGSDGCNHVWVVNKDTPHQVEFDFNTATAGDPNFRDEGLACDPNTFAARGEQVMWSKEAYSPMRAHAFVIPDGTCGIGGLPPAGNPPPSTGPAYVAFGDSLTTGYSVPKCGENREASPWGCDGSDRPATPYPDKVAQALGYSFSDDPSAYTATAPNPPPYDLDRVGIWGYKAQDAYADFVQGRDTTGPWEPQFTAIGQAQRLVTGELGVNDLRFSDVLYWLKPYLEDSAIGTDRVKTNAQNILNSISPALDTMFAQLEQAKANGAEVVVTLVYNPFADGLDCGDVHTIAKEITDVLDNELTRRAQAAGLRIADFRPAFIGHASGDSDHYTFGSHCATDRALWDEVAPSWLGGGDLKADFDPHPNDEGTTAMANAILAAL